MARATSQHTEARVRWVHWHRDCQPALTGIQGRVASNQQGAITGLFSTEVCEYGCEGYRGDSTPAFQLLFVAEHARVHALGPFGVVAGAPVFPQQPVQRFRTALASTARLQQPHSSAVSEPFCTRLFLSGGVLPCLTDQNARCLHRCCGFWQLYWQVGRGLWVAGQRGTLDWEPNIRVGQPAQVQSFAEA